MPRHFYCLNFSSTRKKFPYDVSALIQIVKFGGKSLFTLNVCKIHKNTFIRAKNRTFNTKTDFISILSTFIQEKDIHSINRKREQVENFFNASKSFA